MYHKRLSIAFPHTSKTITEDARAATNTLPRFQQEVGFGSVWLSPLILAFPLPKVGQGPKISKLSHSCFQFSSIDWPTESSLPCDRGIKTNNHRNRKVFLDDGERLFLMKKNVCKSLTWTNPNNCCSLFNVLRSSFSLNSLAG